MDIILVVYDRRKKEYILCDGLDDRALRLLFKILQIMYSKQIMFFGEMGLYQVMKYLQDSEKDGHDGP